MVDEIAFIFCTASLTLLLVIVKDAVSVPFTFHRPVLAVDAVAVEKTANVAADAIT